MPAVSVVMPVYNTRDYVARAIESVLGQTFGDFELLIVDNGSTDGSGAIIDRFAAQDARIRVLRNEKNVLIAQARNSALDEARGEYLCLVDSDDWVLPDMLEVMVGRARRFDAQYVVAGYYMDYCIRGRNVSYAVCPDDRDYGQREFRENAVRYLVHTLLTVPWNKLYSMAYLRAQGIRFRDTKLEDHHFNMDILMDVERVSMVERPLYYYYRSRPGTDSELVYNQCLNQKKRDHIAHTLAVYAHWGIGDERTLGMLADYHMGRLVQCVAQTVANHQLDREEKRRQLREIVNDRYTAFAVRYALNRSKRIALLSVPIRMKSVGLCTLMGWTVGAFKHACAPAYYAMRASVAQGARRAEQRDADEDSDSIDRGDVL